MRGMGRESRSTADQLDLYASSVADLEGRQEFRKPIRLNDHTVARHPVTAGRSHVAQTSHFDEFEPRSCSHASTPKSADWSGSTPLSTVWAGTSTAVRSSSSSRRSGHLAKNVDLESLRQHKSTASLNG